MLRWINELGNQAKETKEGIKVNEDGYLGAGSWDSSQVLLAELVLKQSQANLKTAGKIVLPFDNVIELELV